ncbi:uncharacterized protein LOC127846258, partial [Dreissena polymorpha]|uniref:uncharacterized protein LOC127846258 n=1 Tax=Dreissena polymorpha TaxID=45954 RepID=UPI00226508BF
YPTAPVKSTSNPLPANCYSPDGTDCSWYRDCLESQHYNMFDNNGQLWIDAVRKCLQIALVPLIRQYKTVSCSEIKQTAFESHSRCYTSLFPGAPSICFIGARNIFQVFVTIKSAFTNGYKATRDQLLETAAQEGSRHTVNVNKARKSTEIPIQLHLWSESLSILAEFR